MSVKIKSKILLRIKIYCFFNHLSLFNEPKVMLAGERGEEKPLFAFALPENQKLAFFRNFDFLAQNLHFF